MRISDWSTDVCSTDLVYSRIFATTIDFQFEIEPVTFVKRCHASTLYRADMYKSIGLPVIALNKAKDFHSIEELDRATRLFSRALALGKIGRAACRERGGQYV